MSQITLIPVQQMKIVFQEKMIKYGFDEKAASECAEIFTSNSIDGVYTHGVNRFPRFIHYVKEGFIKTDSVPALENSFGGMEQWNGHLGPGPLNAVLATERVQHLARQYGIGCVALAHTNHWMRGGYYGWQAAKNGFVFVGWTNTIANLPAWNAADSRLGNNPLVIALPYEDEAIVLDMAMSQYSFGAMELAAMKQESLPVIGGYDTAGALTQDPSAILVSKRPLPIGYWKGAGLSLLLDILATLLSDGLSTAEISKQKAECNVSQVYIAIDLGKLKNRPVLEQTIRGIIDDYHQSMPVEEGKKITYPGERVLQTRKKNLEKGIPVLQSIWDEVLRL